MRQLILQFWISLDGYSCDPFSQRPALMADVDDPEHDKYFLDRLGRAGTHIMGRTTYQAARSSPTVASRSNSPWPGSISSTSTACGWCLLPSARAHPSSPAWAGS